MGNSELNVLVVDDDFRVANLHAGIVNAIPGFAVAATVNTLSAARKAAADNAIDLALVDVYLPDGSGVDLVRELRCDAFVLTAATEAETIRSALSAGALKGSDQAVHPCGPRGPAGRICAIPPNPRRPQPRRTRGGRRVGRASATGSGFATCRCRGFAD